MAPSSTAAPASLRALLSGLIDYAGLYPPAELEMSAAVAEYARQRSGADAWGLGRFVVGAARLEELATVVAATPSTPAGTWPLSVLLGADYASDFARLSVLAGNPQFSVDGLEAKATTIAEVDRLFDVAGSGREIYVEVPLRPDPSDLLARVAALGGRGKARTGGIVPDLFPAADDVVRFFEVCRRLALPFKLTAGLHHPLAGDYRLTYRPDAARGRMFGFVTMFAAAAAVRGGWPLDMVARLIAERDPGTIRFDETGMHWRGRLIETAALRDNRQHGALGFGSCSFEEPFTELRGIGYLPA